MSAEATQVLPPRPELARKIHFQTVYEHANGSSHLEAEHFEIVQFR